MKKNLLYSLIISFAFFNPILTEAQTGPGGVGNATGTDGQPENAIWFDASSLGLSNGNNVSLWNDISGNGYNGEQPVSAAQPVFHDQNQTGYNFPAVIFDGTDDFIPFSGDVIAGKDYTMFVVAQRHTNDSWNSVLMGGTDAGTNMNLHWFLTSSEVRTHHYGNDLQSDFVPGTEAYSAGTNIGEFGIFATSLNSNLPSPERRSYQNNHYLNNISGSFNNGKMVSWEGSSIAKVQFGSGNPEYFSEIDVAEVIIFAEGLNEAQLEIINNYLSEKYGIVIDNDLYTAPANFELNVAGIGNRNNFKHSRSSSAGFYFYEKDNTLNDGEFVFASHDATANNETNIDRSADVTTTTAVAAWARQWYMTNTASANVDLQLIFDFQEAFENGKYPKNIENYVLLWRAATSDAYAEVNFTESGLADVDQVYFNVSAADFQEGYYTLGTKNETNSPLSGSAEKTWYALKSGNWNDWETWTLDPSGNLPNNPDHELPSDYPMDKIVIHSGKTVTVNIDDIENNSIIIDGRLDLGETKNHQFDFIKGTGRILMAEDNFPSGDATHFYSQGQGEGTVIFYGTSDTLHVSNEFYNFEIELASDTDTLTLLNDLTVNGNFEIKQGVFKINHENSTNILNITVKKNLSVYAQGEIRTGKGKTIAASSGDYSIPDMMPIDDGKRYHSIYHQLEIWGNFTNNGIVRFTNLDAPVYNQFAPNGVTVTFKGASNNTVQLEGTTDFYNLVVDKGTSQTYILEIYASAEANFDLYGPNNVGRNQSSPFSAANPEVRKALFIQNGTLKLSGLVHIPTLSEGSVIGGNGDFAIGRNAQLWLAGNVKVYSTADEASQVAAGSGATINTGTGVQALSVYGKFRISDGIFGTRNSAGFIFWTSAYAQVQIDGGECYVAQLRSAGGGGGVASYTQTGGKVYLEGNNNGGEYTGDFPLFGLDTEDGVFQMSGGEIIIQDRDNDADPEFYIPSAEGNYNVTGGTVRFELPQNADAQIFSTANLWNLELVNTDGSGNVDILLDTTLIISNDLTINPYTTLDVADPSTSEAHDVFIGRNFSILEDGTTTNTGVYQYRTNTTTFDGDENGELYIGWNHDDGYEQNFYNLTINKPAGKQLLLKGDHAKEAANVGSSHLWFARLIYVENDFKLESGIFNQGEHSVRLFGTVAVSSKGVCGVYEAGITQTNACFVFRGDGLTIQTENGAEFGNIKIDVDDVTNDEIAFSSDVYIKRIGYTDGKVNIGSNNIKVDFLHDVYSTTNYDISNGNSTSEMFYSSGNASDGGLSLRVDQNATYGFPVGVSGKYTPAEAVITNLTDTAYITINPVDHYLWTLTDGSGDVLDYYWRLQEDFDTEPDVFLTFHYDEGDAGNENSYRGTAVINFKTIENLGNWSFNKGDNEFYYANDANPHDPLPVAAGNYTAGNPSVYKEPRILYARKNGLWHDPDTWSTARDGSAPLTKVQDLPSYGDIVVIGNTTTNFYVAVNDDTYNTYIGENQLNNSPINIAVLSILRYGSGESSLVTFGDSKSNREAHNFGVITNRDLDAADPESTSDHSSKLIFVGEGIPQGDFGEFITAPNTIWTYSREFPGANSTIVDENGDPLTSFTVNSYTITDQISEYPTLQFEYSGLSGGYISFPNKDIVVHNQIRFFKDHQHIVFNTGTEGDVTVEKDIVFNNGNSFNIEFQSHGTPRTLTVLGDIDFDSQSNSIYSVKDSVGTLTHKLILHGNVINPSSSSDFEFYRASNKVRADFEFQGENNSTFAQMTDIPSFNQLIVNKGTDTTYQVLMNTDFNLCTDTAGFSSAKPVQMLNGSLILNHSGIDITLNNGNYDFKIPATAELQINQGTVRTEGDDTGILLDGKLSINGGNALFNGAGNGNNYIHYTVSRSSEIEISGGSLMLGGQLCRRLNTEEGVLKYKQTGGSVELGTSYPKENTRGVFEIFNEGSSFEFTSGSLIIAQSQPDAEIASFYFNPETLNLATGSEIVFGSSNTIATGNNFGIYAEKNLQNIVIDNSSNTNPTLKIWTVPLNINEDLIIGNNSTFNANGLTLYIGEDLENNGNFKANENLTVFNGSSVQSIKGTSETEFYRFTKPNSNTLTLYNNIFIEDEFRIEDGTLDDNSNTVTLYGDIYNTAVHAHGGSGNGIVLNGSDIQYISGSGTYGKLSINNPYGVQLKVGYNILINDMLKLENGVLNIGGNLLTIAKTASIFPENPFSKDNMIETNISFTDNGVKKYFPQGTGEFIYPIGAGGKYTPIKVIANSNPDENGFLIAKAANERHPSIQEDEEAPENVEIPDTANVLQYYWSLTASDFTDVSGNVEFYYDPVDTLASNAYYNISDYIPARLLENSTLWNKYGWEDFDEVSEKIVFKFENVSSDEISGDYTAGVQPDTALLKGAIPDQVATYETVASGNWTDETIWSPQIHGGPKGAIVLINPEHTVTANRNYLLTHRIQINGRLETGNTFGNRLGLVSGTGTLSTTSGLLPAGFYNKFFFAKSGGTLEYTGSSSYDALNNLAEVNNVRFTGTGERRLPNLELRLVGSFWIEGDDATLEVINEYDNKLTVDGDVILTTGTFDAGTGDNAILELAGSESQTITGDFTGTNSFNSIKVNNSAGINVTDNIDLNHQLILTSGGIKMLNGNKMTMHSIDPYAVIGYSCDAYVEGVLSKKINGGNSFVFPVGKTGRCGFLQVLNTNISGASSYWEAEYFNEAADNGGFSTEAFSTPITFVNKNEYWNVKSVEANTTADVKLYWDDLSGLPATENEQDDWRIVKWTDLTSNDEWVTNSVSAQVNHTDRTISSESAATINFNEWTNGNYFTFATVSALPTITWTGAVSEAWEDAGNWDTGNTPYSATDVVIPDVTLVDVNYKFPVISSDATCNALTIDENASLIIGPAHTLRATGNTEVNGFFALGINYHDVGEFIDNGTLTAGANADMRAYRWVPGGKYSYISSPVSAAVRDTFNNDFGVNPNFYWFDETIDDTDDWMEGWTFGHSVLEVGRGYASGWPGIPNHLKFYGGVFNTGNIGIDITHSNYGEASDGWNLVGNPYPSSIDAATFVADNSSVIDGALYFWDDDGTLGDDYGSGDYATWNLAGSVSGQTAPDGGGTQKVPDGTIAMAQGFFVKASSPGTTATLSFNNGMRVFGNGQFFNTKRNTKTENKDFQRIRLSMQNKKWYNELLLTFTDKATDSFDKLYDAKKMLGSAKLAFFSILYNEAYSIQSQGLISNADEYKTIPLGYRLDEAGDYTINLKGLENINASKYIYLDDQSAENLTDLRVKESYTFSAKAGENKSRFRIVFSDKPLAYDDVVVEENIRIYSYDNRVAVEMNLVEETKGSIQISSLSGQIVKQIEVDNDYYFNIPLNVREGFYIVKLTNNNSVTTKKVFIKR